MELKPFERAEIVKKICVALESKKFDQFDFMDTVKIISVLSTSGRFYRSKDILQTVLDVLHPGYKISLDPVDSP